MNTEAGIGLMITLDPLKDAISSVGYVDHMGSDLSVVNAARVSMDKKSNWAFIGDDQQKFLYPADSNLIDYLAEHNHWTPFGHAQLSIRVKAPIFIARQLAKHQVGLVWNEESRRYISNPPDYYLPEFLSTKAKSIKQGSTGEAHPDNLILVKALKESCDKAIETYNYMIGLSVAPEDARMVLPLNLYTEWIWTGSLAAWARIINLRCDSHTQRHTRAYGAAIFNIVEGLFPISIQALCKNN